MPSYHQITIMGHLGRDVETRFLPDGKAVANFSVAVGEKWKGKDGERHEHTEWYRCSVFGVQAEWMAEAKKGALVFAAGRLRTRKYTSKEGGEKTITELVCDTARLLARDRAGVDNERADQGAPAALDGVSLDDDIPF